MMVRRLVIFGFFAASMLTPLSAAFAYQSTEKIYQIPAMPLKDALVAFAEQSGFSISFDGAELEHLRSGYVIGAKSPVDALTQILARSPYDFEIIGEQTVRLTRRKRAEQAPKKILRRNSGAPSADNILVTATKRYA
ncbi:MAG: STN domain-containing protein, partial [Marinicaulis sp.]|nr:STN domain-containing protein [Marinicaulis sp.]